MSTEPKNPITLALRSYGILLIAVLVAILPYAFTDSPEATAELMQNWGAWSLGLGGLVALLGYLAAVYALVRSIMALPASEGGVGLVLALLPLFGVPWLLISSGILHIVGL